MRVQDVRRQADGGRRVALDGLRQNLAPRNSGQLPHDLIAQVFVGENPEPLGRDQRRQPVHRGLDQGPFSKDREHLFGAGAPAARPESRTAAASQDHAVVVRHDYRIG